MLLIFILLAIVMLGLLLLVFILRVIVLLLTCHHILPFTLISFVANIFVDKLGFYFLLGGDLGNLFRILIRLQTKFDRLSFRLPDSNIIRVFLLWRLLLRSFIIALIVCHLLCNLFSLLSFGCDFTDQVIRHLAKFSFLFDVGN